MKLITLAFRLTIVIVALLMFVGCSKSGSPNPAPPSNPPKKDTVTTPKVDPPTITGLSVNTGPYGTTVIISGTNFIPYSTQVFFNGKSAAVTAVTTTQLTVTVPLSAGTGAVSVKVADNSATGPIFTYQLSQVISTFAGYGTQGISNGLGISATFNIPTGLALDAAGNLYVADEGNMAIRKITPDGMVSTFAGGTYGASNGIGTAASFGFPTGIAVDQSNNLFVADNDNSIIRKITSSAVVSTYSGGSAGFNFYHPNSVAVDANGKLYITDTWNNMIRTITAAGYISTLAGKYGTEASIDGTGVNAAFDNPTGIAVDASGNVFVADGRLLVRKITPDGVVTTFAGGGPGTSTDGQGTAASFRGVESIALDASGNVYVADQDNKMIRKITPQGMVSTIAGKGNTAGLVIDPSGIAVTPSGSIIYFSDYDHNKIMKITLE